MRITLTTRASGEFADCRDYFLHLGRFQEGVELVPGCGIVMIRLHKSNTAGNCYPVA